MKVSPAPTALYLGQWSVPAVLRDLCYASCCVGHGHGHTQPRKSLLRIHPVQGNGSEESRLLTEAAQQLPLPPTYTVLVTYVCDVSSANMNKPKPVQV